MSLKILLADDSMTAQNMGKKILSDAGYDVVAVSNGAQAVKKIAEHKPDIAILDIYMPGYTGLEVCDRVKNTLESSKTPVLLTVGKMEPYRPEDGSRVHADGVIVKPFEATDLLAIVEKLAGRIAPASKPQPSYEETMVIPPPTEADFNDETYSQWKQSSQDGGENTGPDRVEVPQEMQVSPAMGFEDFGVEPVNSEIASSLDSEPAPQLAALAVATSDFDLPAPSVESLPEITLQPIEFTGDSAASDEPLFSVAPDALLETAPSAELPPADAPIVQPFEVEFTSAPSLDDLEVAVVPELEATVTPSEIEVSSVTDPALASPTEMVSEFATGFGAANEEEVPVGIIDELRGSQDAVESEADGSATGTLDDFEARVAAAMAAYSDSAINPTAPEQSLATEPAPVSEWKAEEAPVEADEASISLEEEMARLSAAASEAVVAPAPVVEPEPTELVAEAADEPLAVEEMASAPEPVVESFEAPSAQDMEFAAAMAAAIKDKPAEPELALAASAAISEPVAASVGHEAHAAKIDESRIAHALQRVLERFKPQLVAEIARELANEEDDSNK